MEYFNHFTLSTGHSRKTSADELNPQVIFKLGPVIKDIENKGGICEFTPLEGTYMQIMHEGDFYSATLYVDNANEKVPVFVSCATINKNKMSYLNEIIEPFRDKTLYSGIDEDVIIPDAPVIVDIPLPTIAYKFDIAEFTGDLSRCLAWTILSPASVVISK